MLSSPNGSNNTRTRQRILCWVATTLRRHHINCWQCLKVRHLAFENFKKYANDSLCQNCLWCLPSKGDSSNLNGVLLWSPVSMPRLTLTLWHYIPFFSSPVQMAGVSCWDRVSSVLRQAFRLALPPSCVDFSHFEETLFLVLMSIFDAFSTSFGLCTFSDTPLHTLSKLYDEPVGFVTNPSY